MTRMPITQQGTPRQQQQQQYQYQKEDEDEESHTAVSSVIPNDVEKQEIEKTIAPDKVSAFKGLGWLDRFLAVWILLAMAIGLYLS
jgi:hypothetical protein